MIIFRICSSFYKYKRKVYLSLKSIITTTRGVTTKLELSKKNASQLKILFFGTDNFSLTSLRELHEKWNLRALGAVTSFKSPANSIRLYAQQQQIPLYAWELNATICGKYDLGVVVSFGHLIPERIIKAFPLGMINVHASLLPRWRGAAPVMHAIMNGDKETGVSIMRIEPKHFDVGDILLQKRVPITCTTLLPELHERLAKDGAALLSQVIQKYPESFENTIQQNHAVATLAPKISNDFTVIQWSSWNAIHIYNRYRAFYNFKNLSTKFQNKTLQLIELELPPIVDNNISQSSLSNKKPGSFLYSREWKCLQVCCASETLIRVHKLRIAGKKIMTASDFNNGFLKKLSDNECLFETK